MTKPTFEQIMADALEAKPRTKPAQYRDDWHEAVARLADVPECGLDVLMDRDPQRRKKARDVAARALANLKLWHAKLEGE